jgi:hypothetical protein
MSARHRKPLPAIADGPRALPVTSEMPAGHTTVYIYDERHSPHLVVLAIGTAAREFHIRGEAIIRTVSFMNTLSLSVSNPSRPKGNSLRISLSTSVSNRCSRTTVVRIPPACGDVGQHQGLHETALSR